MLIGTLGSGKSYESVAYHIIPSLEAGRKVVTNMPLNLEHFAAVYGQDILKLIKLVKPTAQNPIPFKNLEDYQDDWRDDKTGQACLFVIDECHKSLGRGRTALAVEEWFAESRHNLHDILLVTQSYGKVSKNICDMLQLLYRVRKNVALGFPSSYVRKVLDGIGGSEVNSSIRVYDSKFYPFYKSHTQTQGLSTLNEAMAKDIVPIWRNWTFIGAAILLPLGLYFLLSRPMPFNQQAKPIVKPVSEQIKNTTAHSSPAPTNQPTTQQAEVMESKTKQEDKVNASHPFYKLQMHIGGFLESEDKKRFMYNVLLSQNGQVMSNITDKDLLRAGYTVEAMGACVFKISYKNFYDFITCDSPRVSPNADKNFNDDKAQKT